VVAFTITENRRYHQARKNSEDEEFAAFLGHVCLRQITLGRYEPTIQDIASPLFLRKILEGVNLSDFDVHVSFSGMVFSWTLSRALLQRGVPTLYDLADDLPGMVATNPRIPLPVRPMARTIARLVLQRNILGSKALVTINEGLRQLAAGYGGDIYVVPNGVDCDRFAPSRNPQLRSELGLGDAFVLGFEGALREWVDFSAVFGAMRILEHRGIRAKLLIIGQDYTEGRLLREAVRFGQKSNLVNVGAVRYSDVPRYVTCMDVGLVPFVRNPVADRSLPLKLLEYMACGVPVVSTELGGVKEFAGSLVQYADNAHELAQALVRVAQQDPTVLEATKQAARLVRDKYDWKILGHRFESALVRTLDGRCGGVAR